MKFNLMRKSALAVAALGLVAPLALSNNVGAKKVVKPSFRTVRVVYTNKPVRDSSYFGANAKGQYQRGYHYLLKSGYTLTTKKGHVIKTSRLKGQLFKITKITVMKNVGTGATRYYVSSKNGKYVGFVDNAAVYNKNVLRGKKAVTKRTVKPRFRNVRIAYTNKPVRTTNYFGANAKGQYQRGYHYLLKSDYTLTTKNGRVIKTNRLKNQLFKINKITVMTNVGTGATRYYVSSKNGKYAGFVDNAAVYNKNVQHSKKTAAKKSHKVSKLHNAKVSHHARKTNGRRNRK
ncbi:hypothetical protein WR164_15580 [Philodulcilactobacillus myokoensis]|uniref:Uncharacterized protein n=1 Tax=Philodulcilactobacillus myokoensis TaxID=2929573 RepID=A0A9W6B513_9LACO|nr:hypothetical protein [Philodulcilactobacillus myokoensis]GLB47579.1 hypothetical protein WR164_15580 [Philodulcilactobacillus myokoensis]